jgi:eukaryotic-like serine/threonine-protein kinase
VTLPIETGWVGEPLQPGAPLSPQLTVTEHIRRGRHLDVYEAYDHTRFCHVLVKTARPELAESPSVRTQLRSEWSLLSRLAHPHIVKAYGFVSQDGGPPLLVLEVLTGATLRVILDELGRLRLPHLAALGEHLTSALRYVHAQGYLHLDVKPSNVISDAGVAKLLDFSLARPPGTYHRHIGTFLYSSPEQLAGEELSTATDVWGVGLVLFEALTGQNPFNVRTDVLPAELSAPRVRTLRRVPASVAHALDACLDQKTANRPTLADLSEVLSPHIP